MAKKPSTQRCHCGTAYGPKGRCPYNCPPRPPQRAADRHKPVGVKLAPTGLPTHGEVSAGFKRAGLHKPYESRPFTEKAAAEWRRRRKARKGSP